MTAQPLVDAPSAFRQSSARPSLWRIYRLEARLEFLKLARMPAFAIPTVTFPLVFYVFFGIIFGPSTGSTISMATYLLATYGVFGVIGASLFGFGVGVAVERGQGWMVLKRASPMPAGAYFAAKIFMSLIFSAVIVTMLYTLGAIFGGVELAATSWLTLATIHLLGAFPFCALGLAIGYFAGPNSAPAIVNLIYLPLSILSGLWIPIQALPELLQHIALGLPPYHFAQLALKVLGADMGGSNWFHLTYLTIFAIACLAIARIGYRRDEDKTYG